MHRAIRSLAVAGAMAVAACAPRGPQPIAYGAENCEVCRMTISEPRFGAEVVTKTGKVRKFDSVECLASYVLQARSAGAFGTAWVTDYRRPGRFVAADSAVFIRGGGPHSPMGLRLVAFAPGADSAALVKEFGGDVLRWPAVLAYVERNPPRTTGAALDAHTGGEHAPDDSAQGGTHAAP